MNGGRFQGSFEVLKGSKKKYDISMNEKKYFMKVTTPEESEAQIIIALRNKL